MHRHASLQDQLSDELQLTTVTGVNNRGLDFNVTLSTASLQLATLERDRDEMSCQLQDLAEDLHKLIELGEREYDKENWGILFEGKLLTDGHHSKDEARDALRHAARGIVAGMDVDSLTDPKSVEQSIFKAGDVKLIERFPASRSIVNMRRRISAQMNQIQQLDQLIEKLS